MSEPGFDNLDLSGEQRLRAFRTRTAGTADVLFVAIFFSQAPHFGLVQGDVIVDPEVVQPAVITCRVDLERGRQVSERSLWERGKTWVCRAPSLNQAPVSEMTRTFTSKDLQMA